jgi:hypothetical protein
MSLGSFAVGAKVRLPLQILKNGGMPVSNPSSVKVQQVLGPDAKAVSGFPKNMVPANKNLGVYYFDYTPKAKGNYIVIYTVVIDGVQFSQMDSFYAEAPASNPSARPR